MRHRYEAGPFWGVFALSLVGFLTPGPDLPRVPDISDKIEHAAIFAMLALTGRLARYRVRALLPALAAYAVVSEILQAVLPIRRDGDWHDVVADLTGAVLALLLVRAVGWCAGRSRRPPPPG